MNNFQANAISFWAHQFSEHFQFITVFTERYHIRSMESYAKDLQVFKQAWTTVEQDPERLTKMLVTNTRNFKILALKQLQNLGIPCLPDMLVHMLEELDYFTESILYQRYTLEDEIKYWATEHAENLEFVACQLPRLIKEDSGQNVPLRVKKMLAQGGQLAKQFRSNKNNFKKFMQLKMQHLDSVNELLDNVDQLPLNDTTKQDLIEMLHHEKNEAIFALDRIENF